MPLQMCHQEAQTKSSLRKLNSPPHQNSQLICKGIFTCRKEVWLRLQAGITMMETRTRSRNSVISMRKFVSLILGCHWITQCRNSSWTHRCTSRWIWCLSRVKISSMSRVVSRRRCCLSSKLRLLRIQILLSLRRERKLWFMGRTFLLCLLTLTRFQLQTSKYWNHKNLTRQNLSPAQKYPR